MIEEMQRTVLFLSDEKIKARDTKGKAFEGGGGHEIGMDDEMKGKIRKACSNPNYRTANADSRKWCEQTLNGPKSVQIVSTLTMGAGFGLEEMLKRQDVVCGQIVPV